MPSIQHFIVNKIVAIFGKIQIMKKYLTGFFILSLFINGSCDGNDSNKGQTDESKEVSTGPLTSEEAIFNYLKEEHEHLTEKDVCISAVPFFGDLFVVGYFAYDKGCGLDKMIFHGNEIKPDHSESKMVLLAGGFGEQPEKAVQEYHIQVFHHFSSVMQKANDSFLKGTVDFTSPQVTKNESEIISEVWVQRPAGMIPENSFYKSTLIFDTEGNFITHKKSQQFSIPIKP